MKNDALSLAAALIFLALFAGVLHVAMSSEFRPQHCINIVVCLSANHQVAIDAPVTDGRYRHHEHPDMAMSHARRSLSSSASGDASSRSNHTVRDQAVKPIMRLILRKPWKPPTPNASSRRSAVIQAMS